MESESESESDRVRARKRAEVGAAYSFTGNIRKALVLT